MTATKTTFVLGKVKATTALAVCQSYEVPEEVQVILDSNPGALAFLDALLGQESLEHHAVDFLAHALPKREAVWWACLGLWGLGPKPLKAQDQAALTAAVRWVVQPSEETRRAAEKPAEKAGLGTPAGCLARGVFDSGGSLAPPNLPAIEPGATLTNLEVQGALHLLALQSPPDRIQAAYHQLIALGLGVAQGKYHWAP
jgi:hypothetical protein